MTDHANELRRHARKIPHPQGETPGVMLRAADEIECLRAKIEQMEKQEPVAKVRIHKAGGNAGLAWSVAPLNDFDSLPLMRDGDRLYAFPGAQAQNVPKAVAYLDLGTGGYMDIGTDLTDEALAALPKGRHMLGIVGTYGVDGYVPAQPAPSVPDGFSREDLEAVADGLDGYEKTVNVGNVTGEGDDHLESTTAYAARFIRTMLAAAPEAKP